MTGALLLNFMTTFDLPSDRFRPFYGMVLATARAVDISPGQTPVFPTLARIRKLGVKTITL